VEATISAAGNVTDTKVVGGHPLLIQAAVDALKKWKYEAAGETTTTVVEFRFTNTSND
jgi:outer membrane biosynthesis protein TonB